MPSSHKHKTGRAPGEGEWLIPGGEPAGWEFAHPGTSRSRTSVAEHGCFTYATGFEYPMLLPDGNFIVLLSRMASCLSSTGSSSTGFRYVPASSSGPHQCVALTAAPAVRGVPAVCPE